MTEKRVKANEKQKKSVRTVMKELFNVTSASDDDDVIMKSFLGYTSNLKNDLEKLDIHYATKPAYPGKQLIASDKKLMADVLQMKYSNEFLQESTIRKMISLILLRIMSLLRSSLQENRRHI